LEESSLFLMGMGMGGVYKRGGTDFGIINSIDFDSEFEEAFISGYG
jgi:hypothetical protein